jgi:hypothetical protein
MVPHHPRGIEAMQALHLQVKEKGSKVNNITEFNHGIARALMLVIAMLQDDLHDFNKLEHIDGGLPLSPVHTAAYNEIMSAKKSLRRAHQILVTESIVDSPINFPVDEARINELEMWRGNRPCAG